MKKILITGKDSYIGTSLEKWLLKDPDQYQVDTVDMIDPSWKEKDFSPYDVVFHVAGIAHVKETKQNRDLYFKVNRDLAFETARKAKAEGVTYFIFLSSMSVYGLEKGVIQESTIPNPRTAYGKSKLEAENLLNSLTEDSFAVAILRPPMVYGKGCKGNYPRLAKLATKIPVFPKMNNKRSMVYIDNLTEFLRYVIDHEISGQLFPQNREYVNTIELVELIAKTHGKKIHATKLLNPFAKLGIKLSGTVSKVFGTLVYETSMKGSPGIECEYEEIPFAESVERTET